MYERKGKAGCLTVRIANRGFACCGEGVQFLLYLRQGEEEEQLTVDCALGDLAGGRSLALQIPLEEGLQREGMCLYGKLRRVRDQREILFANEMPGEELLLGRFD